MPDPTDEIAALAAQLRHYLDAHPAAADTLDGIRQWWVPSQPTPPSGDAVRRALEQLIDAGFVKRFRRSDGHVIYRRADHQRGPRHDRAPH